MLPSFVRDSRQSWLLFSNARTWRCRPSELLNIEDDYVAYCLDEAIGYFGTQLEYELDKVSSGKESKGERAAKQKRQAVLDRVLGKNADKPRFADPAVLMK